MELEDQRTTPYLIGFKAKDLNNGLATFIPVQLKVVDELTALNTEESRYGFRLFPNPATNQLNLTSTHTEDSQVYYQVINPSGAVIASGQWNRMPARLNLNGWGNGAYILRVKTSKAHLQGNRIKKI